MKGFKGRYFSGKKKPTKFTCHIGQFYLVATINVMRGAGMGEWGGKS